MVVLLKQEIVRKMIATQFSPSDRDSWEWKAATGKDIPDIVIMAEQLFQSEIDSVFTPDRMFYAYNLELAIVGQKYNKASALLIVARHKETKTLMAYGWLGRGSYTQYSRDEMAEAKFAHCDLALPSRTRITILAQLLEIWEAWCMLNKIPVLVSTTIRAEQTTFLKLHERRNFVIRGSIAYKRIRYETQSKAHS